MLRESTDSGPEGTPTRIRWDAIAALATAQRGYVLLSQLRGAGVDTRALRRAIRDRRLFVRRHALFLVGHEHCAPGATWHAALLLGGRGSVLSHHTAGELWGLLDPEQPLHVTTAGRWRSKPPVTVHEAVLPRGHRTFRHGFPVTTVVRTIVDLASVLPERELARVVNEAAINGWLHASNVRRLKALMAGRRGARALRRVLDARDQSRGRTKSWLEKQFARLVREEGLPRYERGAHVDIGNGEFRECDAVFSEQRVMVELDSLRIHETGFTPARDRRRDRRLQAMGWVIIRLTVTDFEDHWDEVVADLRSALNPPQRARAAS